MTRRTKTLPTASSPDRTSEYAKAVLAGEIVAGPHVRNACRRHLADLKRTDGIKFDRDAAEYAFNFFETVLHLSEGQFEGQPFLLDPSQAFIIGSLFGSNLGGEMYHALLDPLVGQTGVASSLRNFWLVFAVIGVVTAFILYIYNKVFGEDTAATRARARQVMFVLYAALVLGAGATLYMVGSKQAGIPPKTWIQAGILVVFGIGGFVTLLSTRGRSES